MSSFDFAGINLTSPPLFPKEHPDNSFHIVENGRRYGPQEWIALHSDQSLTYDDFYNARRSQIQSLYSGIQTSFAGGQNLSKTLHGYQQGMTGKFPFSLPTISSYANTINPRAMEQVFGSGAINQWYSIAEMIAKGGNEDASGNLINKKVLGLDLETIGDIQHGRGIFGITEIGISEYRFRGNGDLGRILGKDHGYASYIVGLNDDQYKYIQDAISLMQDKKGNPLGFRGLSKDQQVALRRVSQYGGNTYSETFETVTGAIFDPTGNGKFIIASKLAAPTNDIGIIERGAQRLHQIYSRQMLTGGDQALINPTHLFMDWLVKQQDSYFYGANSAFDIEGLINVGKQMGIASADYINALKEMQGKALDVQYIVQAAAAAHNMSVNAFLEAYPEFGGQWSNVPVDSLLKITGFGGSQLHQAFADLHNEGKLVHFWGSRLDKLFDGIDTNALQDQYSSMSHTNGNEPLLYIKYGQLDISEGKEFALIPDKDGNVRAIPNMSIRGSYYGIDYDNSGIFDVTENGQVTQNYAITLYDKADAISNQGINRARKIVLTGKNEEEALERFTRLIGGAESFRSGDVSDQTILDAQVARFADESRRQFRKLLSPSEVRHQSKNATDTIYGFKSMSDAIDITESLIQAVRDGKINPTDVDNIFTVQTDGTFSAAQKYNLKSMQQLENALKTIGFDTTTRFEDIDYNLLRGQYQLESFLGVTSVLTDEIAIHNHVRNQVSMAFADANDGSLETELRKTAAYRKAYEQVKEILSSKAKTRVNGVELGIDKYGVDLFGGKENLGDVYHRLDFSTSIDTARGSANRFLSSISRREFIDVLSGSTAIELNKDGTIKEINAEFASDNSLLGRKFLSESQVETLIRHFDMVSHDSFERGGNINSLAQELVLGINSNRQQGVNPIFERIGDRGRPVVYDYTDTNGNVVTKSASQFFRDELGNTISDEDSRTLGEAISDTIKQVKETQYSDFTSSSFDVDINGNIKGPGKDYVDRILRFLNADGGTEASRNEKRKVIAQMFSPTGGTKGTHSIGTYEGKGLQGFLVMSEATQEMHKGTSAFMLLTNENHSGNIFELLHDPEIQKNLGSYQDIKGTAIADHAIIVELPHINKRVIDQYGNAIHTVYQGTNFEKIIKPGLATNVGENGKLNVYFNDPEYSILSLYRRGGSALPEYALNSEFRQGTKYMRHIFDDFLKDMPSFGSYYGGTVYEPHLTPNDFMRGHEVDLHQGLYDIFSHFVRNNGEIDARNLNPAQQLVMDFAYLVNGKTPGSDLKPSEKLFRDTMKSTEFQEFFKRRMVTGKITNEPWFFGGKNAPNVSWGTMITEVNGYKPVNEDYSFDRTILGLIRKMSLTGDYSNLIDKRTAERAFANIPSADEINEIQLMSAIGSESQVESGSYFYGRRTNPITGEIEFFQINHGDYARLSGAYNMMRPLYTQQGSPFVYDVNTDIDMSLFELSKKTIKEGDITFNAIPISFGEASIESAEYETRAALAATHGDAVKALEHEFIVRTKTMDQASYSAKWNDIEKQYQTVYRDYLKQSRRIAKSGLETTSIRISDETYRDVVKAIASDIGTMYQDKGIISTALDLQKLFQTRDGYNLSYDWTKTDTEGTLRALRTIIGDRKDDFKGIIHYGDVIGYRTDGTKIFHNRGDVHITEDDFAFFRDSINKGDTSARRRLATVMGDGDIADSKFMLYGSEKFTGHSPNLSVVEDVLRKANLNATDKDIAIEARNLTTYLLREVADGALIVVSPNYSGHGSVPAAENAFNNIVIRYREAGRLNDLAALMEQYNGIDGKQSAVGAFKVADGKLIVDKSKIYGQVNMMQWVQDQIAKSDDALDKAITAEIAYNNARGISYATGHRQIMNDHMGGQLLIDKRQEQAMSLRGFTRDGGIREDDLRWVEQLKAYSKNYDGRRDVSKLGLEGLNDESFRSAMDYYSRSFNHDRLGYNTKAKHLEKTITGMAEAYNYYRGNFTLKDINERNILHLSLDDLFADADKRFKSGISLTPEEIAETIFFVDGKPSGFLAQKAKESGIDIANESYSLFIDTGKRQLDLNGRQIDGFLVPIVGISHITEGKTLYETQAGNLAKFMRKISEFANRGESDGMVKAWEEYMRTVSSDMNFLKKESLLYKTAQQYVAPNSAEFLAQDMASTLFTNYFSEKDKSFFDASGQDGKPLFNDTQKTFRQLVERRNEIDAIVAKGPDNVTDDLLAEYYDINAKIKTRADLIAKGVEHKSNKSKLTPEEIANLPDDVKVFSELATLGGNYKNVVNIIGETGYHDVIVGTSERGLQRMGLDLGVIANDLVSDYEARRLGKISEYHFEQMENFIGAHDIVKRVSDIRNATGEGSISHELRLEAQNIINQYGFGNFNFVENDLHSKYIPDFAELVKSNPNMTMTELVSEYGNQVAAATKKQAALTWTGTGKKYGISDIEFTTRGLNQAITDRLANKYKDTLSKTNIAQEYMETVGTLAEFVRFPIFRSEAMVRLVLDRTVKADHIRVSNPAISLITNLDFDGDKIFLATIANGMSIMPSTEAEYQTALSVYKNFVTRDAPLLLAEAIRKGDAFKFDNPNDYFKQKALLFEKLDADHFQEAAVNYAKEKGFISQDVTDKEELASLIANLRKNGVVKDGKTLDFELGLLHSTQMDEMFDKYITDTTRSEAAQVSAIVARYRKQNIGYISTPSFRLRETIFDTLKDGTGITDDEKVLLQNLLEDLTSIDTKSGGILSLAEQTVIDPKHAKDSLKLSQATKFANNVYGLLSHYNIDKKLGGWKARSATQDADYLFGIMQSLGSSVLGDIREEDYREIIQNFIFDKSAEELQTIIDAKGTILVNGKEIASKNLENVVGLNRLYKASSTVYKLGQTFQDTINARDYANVYDLLKIMAPNLDDDQIKAIFNSEMSGIIDEPYRFALTRNSKVLDKFVGNEMYYSSQIVNGNYIESLYRYDANNDVFHNIRQNGANQYFDSGIVSDSQSLKEILSPLASGYGYRDFLDSENTQRTLLSKLSEGRLSRILDDATVGETGGTYDVLKSFNSRSVKDSDIRPILDKLMPQGNLDSISKNARDTMAVYSYVTSQSGNIDQTATELLREMNADIVKRGKTDPSGNSFSTLDVEYANIVKSKLSKFGVDDAQYDEYLKFVQQYPTFSFDEYAHQLDEIAKTRYDIVKTKQGISESFSGVEEALTHMDAGSVEATKATEMLASKEARIAVGISDTIQQNYLGPNNIWRAQQNTVDMMSSNHAMTKFFKWSSDIHSERIVGFGSYLGKSFGRLSAEDISAVRSEAEWLLSKSIVPEHIQESLKKAGGQELNNLQYLADVNKTSAASRQRLEEAVNGTLKALEDFMPTAELSVFAGSNPRIYEPVASRIAMIDSDVSQLYQQQGIRDNIKRQAEELKNRLDGQNVNRLRQQSVSSSFMEQAMTAAKKLTAQQVAAGIAAMAGIGLVNKLLHDEHKRSPLEAGHSGAKQPPIINGQSLNGGAPSTPGLGRTVYHDGPSGLDFEVSARTRQRLSTISGAQGIGLAGGGNAQVYAFNDTSGVSNNWLANKFAELAE